MKVVAGSWLIASVCSERIRQSSSATFAVCGRSSLRTVPHWPRAANLKTVGVDRKRLLPGGHPGQALTHPHRGGQVLAAKLLELRLGIEEVGLRRCTGLEQVNHPLRPGREVGQRRQAAVGVPRFFRGPRGFRSQERGEYRRAETDRGAAEEMAPCEREADIPWSGSIRSFLGDRLVEVQQHAGHRGIRGQLGGVERRVGGRLADAEELVGRGAV